MAVKPKDETGRDWNWARGGNAAIHNRFEENRLSAKIGDSNNPQTGKFGSDGVLISHGASYQSGLPCFGTLAEVGGDLDISTGNFCIAGWLYLRSGDYAGPVDCDIWGYSRNGVGTGYLSAFFGPNNLDVFGVDVCEELVLNTALESDGSQVTYSLVNGVWTAVPVGQFSLVQLRAGILTTEWDNAWHYVAFARYGNELAVYFEANGVAKKRAYYNYAGALPVCNGSNNKLYIGHGFNLT